MKISKTHQRFADRLNDQTALEYPEHFLGPNWKNVLNFWFYLDTLSEEDFRLNYVRYWALDADSRVSAINNAWEAAEATICKYYAYEAWRADSTYQLGTVYASGHATSELIGSHNLEAFTFLPLFLNP